MLSLCLRGFTPKKCILGACLWIMLNPNWELVSQERSLLAEGSVSPFYFWKLQELQVDLHFESKVLYWDNLRLSCLQDVTGPDRSGLCMWMEGTSLQAVLFVT